MFNFLTNCQTVFQSSCNILLSTSNVEGSVFSHLQLLLSVFCHYSFISLSKAYIKTKLLRKLQSISSIPIQVILQILHNERSVKTQWETRTTMSTQQYLPWVSRRSNEELNFYPNLAVKRQCLPPFISLSITCNDEMLKTFPFKLGIRYKYLLLSLLLKNELVVLDSTIRQKIVNDIRISY